METACSQTRVEVTAADLPLQCPPARHSQWNAHPRVFLDVVRTGSVSCPYCGTQYVLIGDKPTGH